jgi:XTP/dITP diphosphohydrolase
MKNLPFEKLLIATGNRHKFKEFAEMLRPYGIKAVPAYDYNIKEPEETGATFEENALIKAKYYSEALNMPALADDSGLCIEGLDNAPGIYSARWANKYGSYEQTFKEVQKLLENKKTDNYNAYFVCNIAIYNLHKNYVKDVSKNYIIFEGKVHGKLKFPPTGCNGFGYDPIFVPKRHNISFGEMMPEEKRKISHRADVVKQLITWLNNFS